MKKRNLLCVFGALAALTLASCGTTNTPEKTEETPAYDAEALVATFEDSIDTTVKLNYEVSYDVNVTREGGLNEGFNKFFHKIRAVSNVEMDLGDDLYIKATKTWKDIFVNEDVTETEEILYKKDGQYYYQTKTTAPVEVAASDARAKVDAILKGVTKEDAGSLSLEALLYNNLDKTYEYNVIGLTTTFEVDEMLDPVYSENSNGGLHVVYKPEYIGYKTDAGMSDFGNAEDGYAAVVTIDTNDKGYVTSWDEQYNTAILDFAIMEPKPRVTITGFRKFNATYGEAITKAEGIQGAVVETAKVGVVKYAAVAGGTYVVKYCTMGDFANMTDVANNGEVEAGKILCIKAKAAEGYTLASVVVNGNLTPMLDPTNAGGFYCFKVVEGDNNVAVTFTKNGELTGTYVTYEQVAGGSHVVKFCTMGDFANMTNLANGDSVEAGKILCIKPTVAAGYVLETISVNGVTTPMLPAEQAGGFYCFAAVAGANTIVVTYKLAE